MVRRAEIDLQVIRHVRSPVFESAIFCFFLPGNTGRRVTHDSGEMYVLGKGKLGNRKEGCYKLTHETALIQNSSNKVSLLAEPYYNKIGLGKEVDALKGNKKHVTSDISSLVSSIVQSVDLLNAAHVDYNDNVCSISTWTENHIGCATGWYFIMPNVTTDGSKGIVIALRHGVSISWDGSKIFHCSSIGNTGADNHVYGTFFGNKK